MIELKRIRSGTLFTGEKREIFNIFINGDCIDKFFGERLNGGKVDIQLDVHVDFEQLLERFGNYNIPDLVNHEKKPMPFFISDFGYKYYIWEKIFLGCFQEIRINNSDVSATIGLSFCLFDEDLQKWTYKYSPKDIFFQASRIRHDKVNIVTKEEIDHISFQIDLRKEFTTTLNASYEELKKVIYEVEQELYERLENPK